MKFIHVADLHCNRERKSKCLKVLSILKNKAEEDNDIKFLFAGDFWDSPTSNTESSGFPEYLKAMKDIIDLAEVYMVYGTPGHEAPKSLEPFKLLGAFVYEQKTFEEHKGFELIALPEPRKTELTAECGEMPVEQYYEKSMEDFVSGFPEKKQPRIVIAHNEIIGEKYPNSMECSSKLGLRKNWLRNLNADYIAMGHIHQNYEVSGVENCWYSGSCPPVNFGETLDSGYNLIEI